MPERASIAFLRKRIRALRQAHGLSQETFAEMAGLGYKFLQNIEGGRRTDVRLSTLEKLAKPFGIEVWQLLAPAMPATAVKSATKRAKKRAPGS